MLSLSPKEILEKIKKDKQRKVKIAITDIDGILRGKYIHVDKLLSIAQSGFGFCNVVFGWDSSDVCYDNVQYTGWHTGYPDANARVDLSTYRQIPWDNQVPFMLADFINDADQPLRICPRQVLKRQQQKASDLGFQAKVGLEFEWFNFQENPHSLETKQYQGMSPLTPGMFGYSLLRAGYNRDYFNALFDELEQFGVPLEGIHTETGPGVYEAALQPATCLEAADRGILFKASVKEIAYRFQIMPTFMAKWNESLPGCSGHIHQSLWDTKETKNVFYAPDRPHRMSKTFEQYLAGQLHCLPDLLPFYAPNVNSYKRLVEGLWAPTKVTWGAENRTSTCRVIPGSEKSTRLESRIGGSDINPYLAIAASLASGLYGIEKQLELKQEAITGNAYKAKNAPDLPRNLFDATKKMEQSDLAKELFGEDFIEHFANTRFWEWRQFQEVVTNWEIKRYFEII